MKIGVLTTLYRNYNYGAWLQAYAMIKALESLGYYAEQILYDSHLERPFFRQIMKGIKKVKYCFRRRKIKEDIERVLDERSKSFENFINNIPHSDDVYGAYNISKTTSKYDVFVVGSDQVWTKVKKVYLLYFAGNCKRIAYAASCAVDKLALKYKTQFWLYLRMFHAIGVREQNSIALLQPYAGHNKVTCVLDPTLLLEVDNWEEICAERKIKEAYVFCYFLGPDSEMRNIARKYANLKGVKLVTIPFLDRNNLEDCNFGDEQMVKVSPADFLSLIKNANYVFTDSFHASVFSLTYKRQFVVFSRSNYKNMDCRISCLLDLFDVKERFLDSTVRKTLNYVIELRDIDYSKTFQQYNDAKDYSMKFLENSLR